MIQFHNDSCAQQMVLRGLRILCASGRLLKRTREFSAFLLWGTAGPPPIGTRNLSGPRPLGYFHYERP